VNIKRKVESGDIVKTNGSQSTHKWGKGGNMNTHYCWEKTKSHSFQIWI